MMEFCGCFEERSMIFDLVVNCVLGLLWFFWVFIEVYEGFFIILEVFGRENLCLGVVVC